MNSMLNVYPPESLQTNVTQHLSLEKVSLTSKLYMEGPGYHDADQNPAYTNFTPPGSVSYVELYRDVSSEELEQQKLYEMPRVRFSW